jgi:hypothetical protein
MAPLAALFVRKPFAIAAVALAFGAAFLTRRRAHPQGSRALLVVAAAWALYAAWEWLVQVRTPEADIRVDLLVIWPVLGLLSLWGLYRAFRPGA